jgi:hypothetical protein
MTAEHPIGLEEHVVSPILLRAIAPQVLVVQPEAQELAEGLGDVRRDPAPLHAAVIEGLGPVAADTEEPARA